ncbi:hypothetical protein H4R18_000726 [Coemansia javaensis]|uniref:6,7-dimethyl-8-ribityllumazine synthase n=1 Tax=Coemansia javaensis TaxID=2761396 RepID=A0A9W8HHF7_9FUNG|nr:hypothetical protein H4R18_000726 [Coemansia javaensis]
MTKDPTNSRDPDGGDGTRVPILRREAERPRWTKPPQVAVVYSAENWAQVEPLVNDLRYELTERYHFSPFSIKITQAESVHDIPQYITTLHQRSDIVFALGVVFRSAPVFEQRLVDLTTRRIGDISVPNRPAVFDCILVRDDPAHLADHLAALAAKPPAAGCTTMAAVWARRAVDTYTMLGRTIH